MREIRTLRATWRGLETWNGRITTAAGAPVLDPTCRGLEVKFLRPPPPYVRVKGRWMYLYRAVDSRGQTIDFLLSAKRDAEAVKRFFRKALSQPHTVNPRTITVD